MPNVVRPACVLLGIIMMASISVAEETLRDSLNRARENYDLEAALTIHSESSGDAAHDPIVHAETCLLLAELLRIDFENIGDTSPESRRKVGARIDVFAHEGLTTIRTLAESSERFRIQADLLGTMMRSKFKARKYRSEMEQCAARAMALDPSNATAYLSAAKLPLFGKDTLENGAAAMKLIERALVLDPDSEIGWIMRGSAEQKRGNQQQARADWHRALILNPQSALARNLLVKENETKRVR